MSLFAKGVLAAAACSALISGVALSATVAETYSNAAHSGFFDNKEEGWYWYKDPVPEPEEEEKKLPELPPMPQIAGKTDTPPQPFTLSWVKEMLPKYMEAAWNNPTPENVEAYFLIQRYVLDRANNFADMAQRIVVGNTALDETMRRPLSNPGATAANLNYAAQTQKMMKKVAEHAGLWFFYKSDCRYCEAQAPIIGFLEREGFPVLAVSLDGGELQSKKFANTFQDAGHAAQLGVTATPAMFLVSTEGKFDLLGMSVLNLNDLRARILLLGVRNGWLTDEELKEATPLINPNQQRDLSKELPKLIETAANPVLLFSKEETSKNLAALAQSGKVNEIIQPENRNFIPPEQLIKLVSGHKSGQVEGDAKDIEEFLNGNQN